MTILAIELRRLLRNKRTLIFSIVLPVVFFLVFGLNAQYAGESVGNGNVSAYVMISMALYGAILATTSGGAMVSVERAAGWSRQLRLTPLAPFAYVAIKMLTALVLGLGSVLAVYRHRPDHRRPVDVAAAVDRHRRSASGSVRWSSRPSGCSWATCCRPRTSCRSCPSAGAVRLRWRPVHSAGSAGRVVQDIAVYTPLYGLNEVVHAPLTGEAPTVDRRGECAGLAGDLHRRCHLAVPQGHRARLTVACGRHRPLAPLGGGVIPRARRICLE